MKARVLASFSRLVVISAMAATWLVAQGAPEFTRVQSLSGNEIGLTILRAPGASIRVDTATNLANWTGLVAMQAGTSTSLQYTDSAAPFNPSRYYRAKLTDTNAVGGDILPTSDGDLVIRPLYHATLVLAWKDKMIYVDPDAGISYAGLQKADLVLLTHSHSDHLDLATVDAVRGPAAVIIAPNDVYTRLSAPQKTNTWVLANGESTNVIGVAIEAIPAYNANHPVGLGNGYVLTIGGKNVYIAGDTGDTPEMRALKNIDIAFLPMNQPYTLTPSAATNVVTAFRPKVVYPYHYRDQSGTMTSPAQFKKFLDPTLGIEIRLRNWY